MGTSVNHPFMFEIFISEFKSFNRAEPFQIIIMTFGMNKLYKGVEFIVDPSYLQ